MVKPLQEIDKACKDYEVDADTCKAIKALPALVLEKEYGEMVRLAMIAGATAGCTALGVPPYLAGFCGKIANYLYGNIGTTGCITGWGPVRAHRRIELGGDRWRQDPRDVLDQLNRGEYVTLVVKAGKLSHLEVYAFALGYFGRSGRGCDVIDSAPIDGINDKPPPFHTPNGRTVAAMLRGRFSGVWPSPADGSLHGEVAVAAKDFDADEWLYWWPPEPIPVLERSGTAPPQADFDRRWINLDDTEWKRPLFGDRFVGASLDDTRGLTARKTRPLSPTAKVAVGLTAAGLVAYALGAFKGA